MIRLTRAGLDVVADVDANTLRTRFDAEHVLRLPGLLAPDLLAIIQRRASLGTWVDNPHEGIGLEALLQDEVAWHTLHFVANSPAFLALVGQLTGCDDLVDFRGRIYRLSAAAGHHDNWHDDLSPDEGRRIGMSINLGAEPYEGGVFRIRRGEAREQGYIEVPNVIPGDAFLFRISPELEHRVGPIAGAVPKTAFAGWFRSHGSDYLASLQQAGQDPAD